MKPSENIDQYLLDQDLTVITKTAYKSMLNIFYRYIIREGILFTEINRSHIINFKNELINKGKSAGTVNMYLTVLRRYFGWLDQCNIYRDITKGIPMVVRAHDYGRAALNSDQVSDLLEQPGNTLIGKRNYAIILLMLHAGLRTIEIHRMNVEDIHTDNEGHWLYIQNKGRQYKDTKIPLTNEAYQVIMDYGGWEDEAQGPMFRSHDRTGRRNRLSCRSIRHMIKRYMEAAGIKGKQYNTHSLRHTCAITAMESGMELYEVQLFMRHSNPQTTELYMRSIKQKRIMENKVGKLLAKKFKKRDNDI